MNTGDAQREPAGSETKRAPEKRRRSIFRPLLFFLLGAGAGAFLFSGQAGKLDLSGMLASIRGEAPQSASNGEKPKEPKILYYVDPMNPSLKTDKPGKAPCGMDLVPVYEEEASSGSESLPPGTVKISPQKQQLIGVQTAEAREQTLSRSIRAVGKVTYDETKISRVQTKFPGWIETVYVNFVGKLVKKNQPLATIYSPELVATQQELLIARKSKDLFRDSAIEGVGSGSASLYEATKDRLRLWDIGDAQIREVEKRGTPIKSLTLYSAVNGFVVARNVYPGQQVSPETELYTIADLSRIWVMAEVYEYEAPMISLGQNASVTFSFLSGKVLTGKVSYISPELDAKTRTMKVRIELPNPDFEIKPDMFANVEFKLEYGKNLAVPAEAVMDSGGAQTVFVALEGGYFEPRRVTLGPRVGDFWIVRDGLKQGELVVTSANFLIDSESQIKSASTNMGGMPGMPGMDHSGQAPAAPAAAGEKSPDSTPANMGGMPGMDHSGQAPAAPAAAGEKSPASAPPEKPGADDHSGHAAQSGPAAGNSGHSEHTP